MLLNLPIEILIEILNICLKNDTSIFKELIFVSKYLNEFTISFLKIKTLNCRYNKIWSTINLSDNRRITRYVRTINTITDPILTKKFMDNHKNNIICLDHNQITEICAEIGVLTNLQHLYLHYNQIREIRSELQHMHNIIKID